MWRLSKYYKETDVYMKEITLTRKERGKMEILATDVQRSHLDLHGMVDDK